jgi:multiple sugar transport system substrate-binding protein
MIMKNTKILLFFAMAALLVLLAGCGGGESNSAAANSKDVADKPSAVSDNTPVKITASAYGTSLDEEWTKLFTDAVKKSLPHITFELQPSGKKDILENLITSGNAPDFIITYKGMLPTLEAMQLPYDLTADLKEKKLDTLRFDPDYLERLTTDSPGQLFEWPFGTSFHALYYNKDIFDKFGVPYPQDGMTWDQTIELARKVSRVEGGVQYHGLDPGGFIWPSQPMSIRAVDAKTGKAAVNNDQWKTFFELLKKIASVPGNHIDKGVKNKFIKDKTLAMYGQVNILTELASTANINWDVAQYPSYPDKPNTYGYESLFTMVVNKTSEHIDQSLRVLDVLTSDEVQLAMSRIGKLSPLNNPEIRKQFGLGVAGLTNKHLQSIFKSKPATAPTSTEFESDAGKILQKNYNKYLAGTIDVNTALRQAEQEINQMISGTKSE